MAVIAEFPAKGEGFHVGSRQHLAAIAAGVQNGFDEAFMLPGKAAEEDRNLVPFFGGEGPLNGTAIMASLVVERGCRDQLLSLRRDRLLQLFLQGKSLACEVAIKSHG